MMWLKNNRSVGRNEAWLSGQSKDGAGEQTWSERTIRVGVRDLYEVE